MSIIIEKPGLLAHSKTLDAKGMNMRVIPGGA